MSDTESSGMNQKLIIAIVLVAVAIMVGTGIYSQLENNKADKDYDSDCRFAVHYQEDGNDIIEPKMYNKGDGVVINSYVKGINGRNYHSVDAVMNGEHLNMLTQIDITADIYVTVEYVYP